MTSGIEACHGRIAVRATIWRELIHRAQFQQVMTTNRGDCGHKRLAVTDLRFPTTRPGRVYTCPCAGRALLDRVAGTALVRFIRALFEAGEFELEVRSNPSLQSPCFTGTVHTHGLARRPPYGTNRPER